MKTEVDPSISRCTYHVFLSFRGKDTRKAFTDHLYTALVQAGIRTFKDNDGIERGEKIKLELQKAIWLSRISVIVFSKDYASSRWCLDELLMILEFKRTSKHIVLSIFYDVDQAEVKNQTGGLVEDFVSHEQIEAEGPIKLPNLECPSLHDTLGPIKPLDSERPSVHDTLGPIKPPDSERPSWISRLAKPSLRIRSALRAPFVDITIGQTKSPDSECPSVQDTLGPIKSLNSECPSVDTLGPIKPSDSDRPSVHDTLGPIKPLDSERPSMHDTLGPIKPPDSERPSWISRLAKPSLRIRSALRCRTP
ncbi:hypothetical protein ACSBR1_018997 [Camellia fascicularis]